MVKKEKLKEIIYKIILIYNIVKYKRSFIFLK